MKRFNFIASAVLLLFLAGVCPSEAATKTWLGGAGDWFDGLKWDLGTPSNGEAVIIGSGTVLLTNSTEYLSSIVISNTATLVFSNWDTKLSATNVTIQSGGIMTLPAVFTNNVMSNNVYVICSNLTIDAGGSINVDGLGYAGGTNNGGLYKPGNGPGYGLLSQGGVGYGAGHGGFAWKDSTAGQGGAPYGSPTNPVEPGSGGCSGYDGSGDHHGGAGGGAVRIEAAGAVTVNGLISANGGNAGVDYVPGGGGSGGSVLIRCRTLEGSSGVIRANGATGAGDGGGGRIAVYYNGGVQGALGVKPAIRFTAMPPSISSVSDIGSVYFPDTYFLSETIGTNLVGQLWGITSWAPTNLVVTNTRIRFAEDGFRLAVTNDVKVTGSGCRLELGGSITWNRDIYTVNSQTSGPTLTAGGNLILDNGGSLYVYAGMTNATAPGCGALVAVTNDVLVNAGSWIYPVSHPTNGGSVRFSVRGVTVAATAGFNANYRGFAGGAANQNGYGPGKGLTAGGDFSSGAGYGGRGGWNRGSSGPEPTRLGGGTYGSAKTPVDAGSAGGCGNNSHGGAGGGVVWIEAGQDIVVNGSITANGETPPYYTCGGGAGGGIYIVCRTITGNSGVFSAAGGNGASVGSCGGGGGGRIAFSYDTAAQAVAPASSFVFSCAGGAGAQYGDLGTLWLTNNQFRAETMSHSVEWIVPGAMSWSPNSLCVSNGWMRFPLDTFDLTVTNGVTVIGTNANLNKLEVSRLTCSSIGVTNASLAIRGSASAPSLTCSGNMAVTNGSLVFDASTTTGMTINCTGNLDLKYGASLYAYGGITNGAGMVNGGSVNVGGNLTLASNAFIYPYSHITNGGSPWFIVGGRLTVPQGAKIDADAKGYGGGVGYGSSGYGPGKGTGYGGNFSAGGGYGGRGGQSSASATGGGQTYGSSNAPVDAGSGGGHGYGSEGHTGGRGGGLVWVRAGSTITLDGMITANGQTPQAQTRGGGSGGGIYLYCRKITGNNGTISAYGGNASSASDGGGGGGRIAVWRVYGDPGQFSCTVSNGTSYTNATVNYSEPGTIFWGQLQEAGTIFVVR